MARVDTSDRDALRRQLATHETPVASHSLTGPRVQEDRRTTHSSSGHHESKHTRHRHRARQRRTRARRTNNSPSHVPPGDEKISRADRRRIQDVHVHERTTSARNSLDEVKNTVTPRRHQPAIIKDPGQDKPPSDRPERQRTQHAATPGFSEREQGREMCSNTTGSPPSNQRTGIADRPHRQKNSQRSDTEEESGNEAKTTAHPTGKQIRMDDSGNLRKRPFETSKNAPGADENGTERQPMK